MDGPVVKTSSAQRAFGAASSIGTAVRGQVFNLTVMCILAPFPHIAAHIEETELVRSFHRDVWRVIAVLPIIPSDAIDVVAAAITEPVAPMGPAPGCIFPLRFRGQTQDGDRERGLTRQLRADIARVDLVQESAGPLEFIP